MFSKLIMQKNNMRERLPDLDRAKGVAIIFVVFGHIVARNPPAENDWYVILKNLIYLFHMPFFMFLTGFLLYISYPALQSWKDYRRYIVKKTGRLIVAFCIFSTLTIVGKMLFKLAVVVDNAAVGWWEAFRLMLIYPTESPASSLWFIYVLAVYYVVVPAVIYIVRDRLEYSLIPGLIAHFLPLSDQFALSRITEYAFVFLIGMCAAKHRMRYMDLLDRYRFVWAGVFVCSFSLFFLGTTLGYCKFIIGLLSIPALHAMVRSGPLAQSDVLSFLGVQSFVIYLMNTIVIGLTKGIILKFTSWDGIHFILIAPVLLTSGLLIPIVLANKALSKIPVFKNILR
jgi:fucose 4-O-acetylase-like acetyltransferase